MRVLRIITVFLLIICFNAKAIQIDSLTIQKAEQIISEIKQKIAPDKRTEVANIHLIDRSPLTFAIETTTPKLINEIKRALKNSSIPATIRTDVLPAIDLGDNLYGIANLSVTNNRSSPNNAAEMVTQMLLGTPVEVLKKQRGYYLVRTPDRYISWVDRSGLALMNQESFINWKKSFKIIYIAQYGHAYETPKAKSLPVSDLVAGNILQLIEEKNEFYKVLFPDRRTAYIFKKEAKKFNEWLQTYNPDANKILATAKTLIGVPYLWGGTSIKGVDCSGFTKLCYFLNGIIIPRDASQQALVGEDVDIYDTDSISISKCLKNLKTGDLLFFSSGINESKQTKITHTAIYINHGQFIQSSGFVKISSLMPQDSDYEGHNFKRLVKAKRILNNNIEQAGIIKINKSSYYMNY